MVIEWSSFPINNKDPDHFHAAGLLGIEPLLVILLAQKCFLS